MMNFLALYAFLVQSTIEEIFSSSLRTTQLILSSIPSTSLICFSQVIVISTTIILNQISCFISLSFNTTNNNFKTALRFVITEPLSDSKNQRRIV